MENTIDEINVQWKTYLQSITLSFTSSVV